jgi:hypothetical protein
MLDPDLVGKPGQRRERRERAGAPGPNRYRNADKPAFETSGTPRAEEERVRNDWLIAC